MSRRVAGITLTAIFTAVIATLSVVSVPLPMGAISLALLGVYLAAYLLPMRYAVLSPAVYILLGIIGLPVFAGFGSGVQVLLGPTGGYILSYPIVAAVITAVRRRTSGLPAYCFACVISLAICYAMGTAWYCCVTATSFLPALAVCVLPYIAGDAVKIAAAVFFAGVLNRAGVSRKITEVL